MAEFQTSLSPVNTLTPPSQRLWDQGFSEHATRIAGTLPVELNATLGSGFLPSTFPRAGCPPPVPHRAGTAGILLREAVCPSKLPTGILGRGLPESGILRHLEPAAGALQPSVASRQGWAAPQVEIQAALPLPGLTETCWESCATIAPEPAERWLSLVLAIEPLLEAQPAAAPRFALAAAAADCFRDIAAAPPALQEAWMPGLAAEAAERWIQPSLADAFAARMPVVQPAFTPAMDAAKPEVARFAPAPAAEAAERWIEASVSQEPAMGRHDPRLQAFGMSAQGARIFRDPAQMPPPLSEAWARPAAAEPVESWVEAASAEAVWTARASLPQLSIAVPACAPALTGALPGLAAEGVERRVDPAMVNALAVSRHPIQKLPFAVAPHGSGIFRDPADAPPPLAERWARVPAPEAAESWIEAAKAEEAAYSPAPIRIPAAAIAATSCAPPLAGAAEAPPAEAAERLVEPVLASGYAARGESLRTLPFAVAAQVPAALADPAEVPPSIAETWMAVPAAEPVERWIRTAEAGALAPAPSVATPAFALSVVEPFVPFVPQFARPQAAEPAAAFVKPVFRPIPMQPQVTFPPLWIAQTSASGHSAALAGAASGLRAAPVESMPSPGKEPIPIRRAPALPEVQEAAPLPARLSPAGVTEIYPAAARAKDLIPRSVELNPLETLRAQAPPVEIERPVAQMPQPELHPLEYYCEGGGGSPSRRLHWEAPAIPPTALRFQMKPALDSLEEQAPPKPARTGPAIAEIFSLPEARQRSAHSSDLGWVGKIAAGIMVAFALWSGSKIANFGKQQPVVARDNPGLQRPADPLPLVARGAEPQSGPIVRLRQAIATRAAASVGDTFHGGMEAWGAGAKSLAPGWSHSPDGYVRVGDLALFQPTRSFADYRLEFYGQIEKKSIGWVMRAKDKQNYYAMKFTVVEPGLRPMIAMVHYPVVGGKRGHRSETPLSVMVHNNTPYHVTVDVKGNHFTASIEGEQVDEWTDDAPGSGAVGFFSDAGEAARLYWAKVSKNQDWIGRFCSYLAGDEARRTAQLWNPGLPPETPAPVDPRPRDFIVTAACEVEPEKNFAPRGAGIPENWRIPLWIS